LNFDFSPEQHALRDAARRFLGERVTFDDLRRRHAAGAAQLFDGPLWEAMAGMGWLGAAIPEAHGGAGLGVTELCVLAEECGRCLAPVPFVLSTGVVAEAIRRFGSEDQQQRHLPRLARGEVVATLAVAEGPGKTEAAQLQARYTPATNRMDGRLDGSKLPVPAAPEAQLALVACRVAGEEGAADARPATTLVLVDLQQPGVRTTALAHFDPFRTQGRIDFDAAAAEPLAAVPAGVDPLDAVLDRAAVLTAFEQIGGADACLAMACAYALERRVFARPIGAFQAIKHRLADMAARIELARSNAWFAAWALEQADAGTHEAVQGIGQGGGQSGVALAAATARIAASEAFDFAARENLQIHGGMGFTWEGNCHPYYTRARHLAVWLGGEPVWAQRLVRALGTTEASAATAA
jgi:acyl-CoA dehydrogenase